MCKKIFFGLNVLLVASLSLVTCAVPAEAPVAPTATPVKPAAVLTVAPTEPAAAPTLKVAEPITNDFDHMQVTGPEAPLFPLGYGLDMSGAQLP